MTYSSLRKGIILAGGKGKRLAPLTKSISKQLMPVYDKPMIYYPLATLMLCGIKEIMIVSDPDHIGLFRKLLDNGKEWGIDLQYAIQQKPEGVAQAVLIGEEFIGSNNVAIALGDNIFHGNDLISILRSADSWNKGGTIFAYPVSDPENYGVLKFDHSGSVIEIEEKPKKPSSQYAVTGMYFYDNTVIERAKKLNFSSRGELEITDLNKSYLNDQLLNVKMMGRGIAWLDTGTIDSLQEASLYIRTLEYRQGLKIGCPEEISWRQGWINDNQLVKLANNLSHSSYGEYLRRLLEFKIKDPLSN
ncbi:glucose-1-phosphate thymidylyltransferase RfbA [Prochlorococcus marinus]|uniref:glucose-1-phosphate thymidylyltransferase RfbA n=1 Tax=Prochlorococcus marinus TaxID=1219 RepID=UPI0022B3A37C|nr:glucose-1-phosphate thymidylyltransferase RfbA [Prochlorococcus marinus]